MTLMEKKKRTEIIEKLKNMMSQKYSSQDIAGKEFFIKPGGGFFLISPFPGEMAVVLEYGENLQDAEQNCMEDGDIFYLSNVDVSNVFADMVVEIEA